MSCPHVSAITSPISGGDLYFCDCPAKDTETYMPTEAERQAYCLTDRHYEYCMFYERAHPQPKHT